MTAKWWDPETFNEQYQKCLDEYLLSLEHCERYDKEHGICEPMMGMPITVKKGSMYRLPPMIVEFCNGMNVIAKRQAKKLIVSNKLQCPGISIYPGFRMNCFDWVSIIEQQEDHPEYDTNKFYVNCNPESEHYGKILIKLYYNLGESLCRIIYNDITELITKISAWILTADDYCMHNPYLNVIIDNMLNVDGNIERDIVGSVQYGNIYRLTFTYYALCEFLAKK